jgi:hypothetical protein
MEMNIPTNILDMYVDGILVGSQTPFDIDENHFLMGVDRYAAFYWGNQTQSGTFFADNVYLWTPSLTLFLDFEDGLLPVEHGWLEVPCSSPPPPPPPVPESSTMLLLASGLVGLAGFRKLRNR